MWYLSKQSWPLEQRGTLQWLQPVWTLLARGEGESDYSWYLCQRTLRPCCWFHFGFASSYMNTIRMASWREIMSLHYEQLEQIVGFQARLPTSSSAQWKRIQTAVDIDARGTPYASSSSILLSWRLSWRRWYTYDPPSNRIVATRFARLCAASYMRLGVDLQYPPLPCDSCNHLYSEGSQALFETRRRMVSLRFWRWWRYLQDVVANEAWRRRPDWQYEQWIGQVRCCCQSSPGKVRHLQEQQREYPREASAVR